MIDGQNLFDQPGKNILRAYGNIKNVARDQEDNYYRTGCWLDYSCFQVKYKLIAIDLSKQQSLNANLKAIEKINFTKNSDCAGNITMFFIIKKVQKTILDFSLGKSIVSAF